MGKVIIMMSTYNGSKYLNDQLNSIYNQVTVHKIKLLIRDDGSTDDTISIITEWKKKLDLDLIKGTNLGPTNSYFELIKYAEKADYYSFADQDDFWYPSKIQDSSKIIDEHMSFPALVFTNAEIVDSNLKRLNQKVHNFIPLTNYINIIAGNSAMGCTIMYNSLLHEHLKKMNLIYSEMYDKSIVLVASLLGKIIYCPFPTMLYRQHQNNVTKGINFKKKFKIWYNRWFKSRKNSIFLQAIEHYSLFSDTIDNLDKYYITLLIKSKKCFFYRFKILLDKDVVSSNPKWTRNFKIRVLFGLI